MADLFTANMLGGRIPRSTFPAGNGARASSRDVIGSIMTGGEVGSGQTTTTSKKSLWSRMKEPNPMLGYALGKTAQALAGRWQDAPFAQMGALGTDLAQKQAMNVTLKRVLGGESITNIKESALLSGEETRAILGEKTRLDSAKMKQTQELVKLFKDVETLDVDIETKGLLRDQIRAQNILLGGQADVAKAEEDFVKARTAGEPTVKEQKEFKQMDIDASKAIQELRNLGSENVANITAETAAAKMSATFGDDARKFQAAQYATAMASSELRSQLTGLDMLGEDEQSKVWDDYGDVWKRYYVAIYNAMESPESVSLESGGNALDELLGDEGVGATPIPSKKTPTNILKGLNWETPYENVPPVMH